MVSLNVLLSLILSFAPPLLSLHPFSSAVHLEEIQFAPVKTCFSWLFLIALAYNDNLKHKSSKPKP